MFRIFGHLGCKEWYDLSFFSDILENFVILCDLLGESYLSKKNWSCSLWVEILVNLRLGLTRRL